MPLQTESEFWNKADKTGSDGKFTWNGSPCWIWLRCRDHTGYGSTGAGKRSKNMRAHRKAWMLTRGPIPDGLNVLHHCDNRPCINPDHCFLGTKRDNSLDMVAKGRQGRQKILPTDWPTILHLRSIGIPRVRIAEMYGVSPSAIGFILYPKAKFPERRSANAS